MKSAVTELQAAAKLGFVATGEKSVSTERWVSTVGGGRGGGGRTHARKELPGCLLSDLGVSYDSPRQFEKMLIPDPTTDPLTWIWGRASSISKIL